MLIGRKKEKELLIKLMNEEESSFVAVYGRRRVGKTYLVRKVFEDRFAFFHTGMAHSPLKKQLAAWRTSLRDCGMQKARLPHTWLDAFDMLKELVKASNESKKLIFIDELPWMDTHKSGFLPALEHFWNGWASARNDVVLIVCGSATSWIINNIIKNHGGLHNRITHSIHLQPFSLFECEQYVKSKRLGMNRRQIMECYMIMGGVPYYWSKLERERSLAQNVDALFFEQDAVLKDEFSNLYASLFKKPEPYIAVVSVLGTKKAGMTREELIDVGGFSDNGKLTEMLENLEACGFIRRYKALGMKSKNALFQLIDSYTLFYYQFIRQNQQSDEHFWSASMGTPLYYNWCGLAFERLCLLHLSQIKAALGISGVVSNACSWVSVSKSDGEKGAQIDLLIDRADDVIDLCEMKYTKTPYSVSDEEMEKIMHRQSLLAAETSTGKAIHLVLVSASGVVRNANANEFQNILTAENLFEP